MLTVQRYIIDEVNAHAVQAYTRNITMAIKAKLPKANIVACGDGAWTVATNAGTGQSHKCLTPSSCILNKKSLRGKGDGVDMGILKGF